MYQEEYGKDAGNPVLLDNQPTFGRKNEYTQYREPSGQRAPAEMICQDLSGFQASSASELRVSRERPLAKPPAMTMFGHYYETPALGLRKREAGPPRVESSGDPRLSP